MSINSPLADQSRRSVITKAVYIAPVVLTLKAVPAFASQGSSRGGPQAGDNPPVDSGIVEPYEPTWFNPPKNVPGARSPRTATARKRSLWSWLFSAFDF